MLKLKDGLPAVIEKSEKLSKQEPKVYFVAKVIKGETYMVMAQSAVEIEDEWSSLYYSASSGSNLFLQPPFEPTVLLNLVNTNNVLLQCIEAMEVNIDGTGHEFIGLEKDKEPDKKELKIAEAFFNEPYPNLSFVTIRRKLRRQVESVGYGFIEVLRNMAGDIVGIRNIETPNVRMIKLDAPIQVKKKISRDGKEIELTLWERERRFAQMVAMKTKVYYREYGTTREIHRETGDWETPEKPVSPDMRGTELMVFGIHPDTQTPYYLPRWINQLPSVVGSRSAEEQNLQFLDAGGMPPAIIFIQGGVLIKDSADQLKMYLSGQNKNKHRAVVVEVQSSSGSLDTSAKVDVKVERFGAETARDAMFMKYDQSAEDHVREAFRLPGLFLGKSDDYNFACGSDDTETLTKEHGWIRRSDYSPEMQIAAYDPKTQTVHFEYPSALSEYDVVDVEMFHYHSQVVDMLFTPKHRMHFRTDKTDYKTAPIEEMAALSTQVHVRRTAKFADTGKKLMMFRPPHIEVQDGPQAYKDPTQPLPANLFLKLLGWYVTEGHTLYTTYAVLTQHPTNYLDEIRKIAYAMIPFGYKVREATLPNGCVQVHIGDYSLVAWLKKEIGTGSENKHLPTWVLSLPHSQLQVLFATMIKGDGRYDDREGRDSGSFQSTSQVLIDQVQLMALKLGYATKIAELHDKRPDRAVTYRLSLCRDGETTLRNEKNLTRELYTGKVHCFSVTTGLYVTRRNGCVAIQGNTAQTAYMVAEAQVFLPERREFDELINKTIVKELGFKSLKLKSLPITLKDVEAQLKGLELSKDVSTRESYLDELNTVSGMTLQLAEMPHPNVADGEVHPGVPTVAEIPHHKLPASTKPAMPTSPQPVPEEPEEPEEKPPTHVILKPGDKMVPHPLPGKPAWGGPKKKTAIELIDLAHDFAAMQGLVKKQDLSAERAVIVTEAVTHLVPEDERALNMLLAQYAFGADDPDLVAIVANSRA